MKKITYGVEINTGDAVNSIKRVEEQINILSQDANSSQKEINGLKRELQELGQTRTDQTENINSVQSLKKAYRELITEIQNTEQGSERFKELTAQAGALKNQLDDVSNSVSNLSGSPFQNLNRSFLSLGQNIRGLNFDGVRRSLGDIGTSIGQLGTSFLGIQRGAGIAANGLKVFRAAIIGTGVGALIIGITTLIANFDTLKESGGLLGNILKGIGNIVSGVTENVLKLSDALGLTENAFDTWNNKRIEEAKNTAGEIDKAEEDLYEKAIKRREALDQNREDFQKRSLESEIQYWRILAKEQEEIVKETTKLIKQEEEKRDVIANKRNEAGRLLREGNQAQLAIQQKLAKEYTKSTVELGKLTNQLLAAEEFTKQFNATLNELELFRVDQFYKIRLEQLAEMETVEIMSLKERQLTNEEYEKELLNIQLRYSNNRLTAHQAWVNDFKAAEQGLFAETIRIRELRLSEEKRIQEEQRKLEEKAFADDERFVQELLSLQQEASEIKKKAFADEMTMLDQQAKLSKLIKTDTLDRLLIDRDAAAKRLQIMEEYARAAQMAQMELNRQSMEMYGVELENMEEFGLATQMELNLQKAELFAIEREYMEELNKLRDTALNKELDRINRERQERQQLANQSVAAFQNATFQIQGIINDRYMYEMQLAGDNQERINEILKEQFEANKAFGIVSTIINTAQAIMNIWGNTPNPVAAGIMSGVVGALGAVQVGIIASQEFNPQSPSGSSFTPNAQGSQSMANVSQFSPNVQFAQAGSGMNVQTAGGGSPQSVQFTGSISVSEINQTQQLVNVYETGSLLGNPG